MAFIRDEGTLKTVKNDTKKVLDLKYLGSRMRSSEKDIKVRKVLVWRAMNDMKIWKSNLTRGLKKSIFIAAMESILTYGCETWTLTKTMPKSLNGCYARMLGMALDVSWQQHMTNVELYDDLPMLTTKIETRRLQLAGHCLCHTELPASLVITWEPKYGRMNPGRPPKTMVNML